MKKCIISQLFDFIIESKDRITANRWLQNKDMKIYVRKSVRPYPEKNNGSVFLDIATVEVSEKKRGKGVFSGLLHEVEIINPWDGIYVENVFKPRFQQFFISKNFHQCAEFDGVKCFFKMKG